ncbi:MAG: hypothetical protein QM775_12625 [Pirellulales bacterium]
MRSVQLAAWEKIYNIDRVAHILPRFGAMFPNWRRLTEPDCDRRVYDFVVQYRNQLPAPPDVRTFAQNDPVRGQYEAYLTFNTLEGTEAGLHFDAGASPAEQLRQLRRIQKFYGDYAVSKITPREVGFRRAGGPKPNPDGALEQIPHRLLDQLSLSFPSGRHDVDRELARTMLVFPTVPPEFLYKVLQLCTAESPASDDLHYLNVASMISQVRSRYATQLTIDAVLRLDQKLSAAETRPGLDYRQRVGELFTELGARDTELFASLVQEDQFGRPEHAEFVVRLPPPLRQTAAGKLIDAVLKLPEEDVAWTPSLIEAFTFAHRPEATERLRGLWRYPGLRDAVVPALLAQRDPRDRAKFVDRLTSADPGIVAQVAVPLRRNVENQDVAGELAAAVAGLRQMCTIAGADVARRELLMLIEQWSNESFGIRESDPTELMKNPQALRAEYQPVFLWYSLRNYEASAAARTPSGVDVRDWRKRLLRADSESGDTARGQALFEKKLCVRCHTGDSRLGPNLDDAVVRYGRSELFATIFEPSRFVPPRYRPTTVELADGRNYSGIPLAETGDLLLLQTGADAVVRVQAKEIVQRRTTTQSIMPLGMLAESTPQDLADLDAYMRLLARAAKATAQASAQK